MEPTPEPVNGFRLRLVLGKFRVTEVSETSFKLQLGGSTTATISRPPRSDIRDGDLLTLYTEVMLNAQPSPTSV